MQIKAEIEITPPELLAILRGLIVSNLNGQGPQNAPADTAGKLSK